MNSGTGQETSSGRDLADKKALIVDDNMMMTTMTQDMLRNIGFGEVDIARSGSEGLAKIQLAKEGGNIFDVVFLDWHMPDMSGFEVLRACREDADLHMMAIVMVTAENQKRSVTEAIKAGATAYAIKPASKEDLELAIDKVMKWREGLAK